MATATLNLQSIELVSTERKVGLNGSPSSQDYDDCQSENLIDHSAIVNFLTQLLPLLNALPAASQSGLLGASIYTDTSDQSALFFDALNSQPLTIADTIRTINSVVQSLAGTVTDVSTQVGVLQAKLSSTNQNDIAMALQNFQSTLNQLSAQVTEVETNTLVPVTAQIVTAAIPPLDTETITYNWPTNMGNDHYTLTTSVMDSTGSLQVVGWSYVVGGVGVNVLVKNNDGNNQHTGTLHLIAIPSAS